MHQQGDGRCVEHVEGPSGRVTKQAPASAALKPSQSSMELDTSEKHLLLWALEHPVTMQLDLSIMSRADLVNHKVRLAQQQSSMR